MNPAQSEPESLRQDGAASDDAEGRRAPVRFLYASGDRPLEGYTIKRGIGRGGFGEVYFAESDAGKEVAMKLIRRNLDVELRGVRHCLNLKHPNLISLFDIRTDGAGDEWVIMEYVSGAAGGGGHSLEDAIEEHPSGMPEQEALAWMQGLVAGVAHLHDNGIVHRDLKPGNIFLDGETVKIGDYGLSKFISCSRRSGQTESVGTVHYMAPEIANGRYGREIDTYALGIILYEMLTGHVPFEGESVGEVLMKHLTAEPDLSRLDEPYREIVRRALAKDPEVRLQSVGELVELLPGGGGAGAAAPSAPLKRAINPGADTAPRLDPNAPISADPRQEQARQPYSTEPTYTQPPQQPGQPAPLRRREDEEPIYHAVVDGWVRFWRHWNETGIHPLGKGLLLFGGIVLLGLFSGLWIPAIITMFCLYLVYYCIWAWFIRPTIRTHSVDFEPHQPGASPEAAAGLSPAAPREATQDRKSRHSRAAKRRRGRLNWREAARKEIARKPLREKATELIGSMLMAAALCVGGSVLAAGLLSGMTDSNPDRLITWLSFVTTLGAWAVLLTNKISEARFEDQAPMRGMMLAFGAVVGLCAGGLVPTLYLDLPDDQEMGPGLNDAILNDVLDFPGINHLGSPSVHTTETMLLSVAYFSLLFVTIRWWRQAELTRDKRFSIWPVVGCGFLAWLLHIFCWFPPPTAVAVAVIVAAATQLASPWMPPSKREELARAEIV